MPSSPRTLKGNCFLIPSGTLFHPGRHHLFVLLTNVCPANTHIAVSLSSIKPGVSHDSTCIVDPGEHPFIEVSSFVLYAKPQQLFRSGIAKSIGSRIYTAKEDCESVLLERIRAGLMSSPFTPRWAKDYFRMNGHR
jgi:hypothetical protein